MTFHPLIFAHRGARTVAPENTLPAFEAALAMQVDGIELDVHCSRDGALVVIHDFEVDTTTDGHGRVDEMLLADLRALDAGARFGAGFVGTRIPTLEEVFDLVGDRCVVNVEIKSLDPYGGAQIEPLLELVHARQLHEQVIVSSFNPVSLIKLRSLDAHIRLGLLHTPDLPLFLRSAWAGNLIRPDALHPEHVGVDATYVAWAHVRGLAVNTWTVNDVDEALRLADLRVDVIMSDVPDRLMAALRA